MSWQMYRWVWLVKWPLHIGAPPAGALNRTRLYVPARALWGALTAEIARRRSPNRFPDYASIGRSIQTNIRLSYLFPSEPIHGEWKAWLPRYREGVGLVWEREGNHQMLEDRPFRVSLLTTRPGTAVDPESETAAEGTLREFELISPYWRDEGLVPRPVALVGYIFCKDQGLLFELKQIDVLWVGGDTRYGLGKLKRVACQEDNRFFDEEVDLHGNEPVVKTRRVLAHTDPGAGDAPLVGAMECLAGWDMLTGDQKIHGLMWAPGSVSSVSDGRQDFVILEEGQWRKR
ncbi:MAG: hypothetical protein QXI12_02380 [Candidatus Methanomethyliaceae archaeon]